MPDPKLRQAVKVRPPYPLGQFPYRVISSIAPDMILSLHTRGTDAFEGQDWERSFARAIGAEWKPSNVGLDDVTLGNCCWGAKTVKSTRPFKAEFVRPISGRNSLDY